MKQVTEIYTTQKVLSYWEVMMQWFNDLVYYIFSLWLCIRGASSIDQIYSDHIMFSALALMGLLQMRLKKSYLLKKSMLEWIKIPNLLLFYLVLCLDFLLVWNWKSDLIFFFLILILGYLEYCAFFKRKIPCILTLLKYSEFTPLQCYYLFLGY